VHDAALESIATNELRAGVRVSGASIVWTVASSAAAVVLGLGAGSIVLVAFGLTGLLDAAGSATLVVHFRHAIRHEAFSDRHERVALRTVVVGLGIVGLLTAVESAQRLTTQAKTRASPTGVGIAAVSIAVLALLSRRKHQLARGIPSNALRADGWLSATGCLLAVVTVTGTGLTLALDWWWADPAAAFGVAVVTVVIALVMCRTETR
jgi:divalent metal cation (Fe/Co/Zn/Cd) transporter